MIVWRCCCCSHSWSVYWASLWCQGKVTSCVMAVSDIPSARSGRRCLLPLPLWCSMMSTLGRFLLHFENLCGFWKQIVYAWNWSQVCCFEVQICLRAMWYVSKFLVESMSFVCSEIFYWNWLQLVTARYRWNWWHWEHHWFKGQGRPVVAVKITVAVEAVDGWFQPNITQILRSLCHKLIKFWRSWF